MSSITDSNLKTRVDKIRKTKLCTPLTDLVKVEPAVKGRTMNEFNFEEITPEQQMKERNAAYSFFRIPHE